MTNRNETPTWARDDLTTLEWALAAQRILARTEAVTRIEGLGSPCLLWQGDSKTAQGYALVSVKGRQMSAHRAIWLALVGDIGTDPDTGETLTIDHLCQDGPRDYVATGCQNIAHMQIVTRAQNARLQAERRTACRSGHEYVEGSYRLAKVKGRVSRRCLVCADHAAGVFEGTATHCLHGHELTPENTREYTNREGKPRRACIPCAREVSRRENRKRALRRAQAGYAVRLAEAQRHTDLRVAV